MRPAPYLRREANTRDQDASLRSRQSKARRSALPRFLQNRALEVEAPSGPHEREADGVAKRLTGKPQGACCSSCASGGPCTAATAPSGAKAAQPGAVPAVLHGHLGAGNPLDASTRSAFEARLGQNLQSVRVHADRRAADASRLLGARAFAVGEHIAFGGGQYVPQSQTGQALIAHELAHVLQSRRDSDASRLRRSAPDDVLRMSIGTDFAQSLSDEDLRLADGLLEVQLSGFPPGSIEHESARGNLSVIRAEASARQIPSVSLEEEVRPVSGEIASVPVIFVAEEIGPEAPLQSLAPTFDVAQSFGTYSAASMLPYDVQALEQLGPGLVNLGLASHVLASGDLSWLSSKDAAARVLSREYWSPFVPRSGQVQLDRLLNRIPDQLRPRIQSELIELATGQRAQLSWQTPDFGFTQAELRSIPDLIRRYNAGTISPAELSTLRRAAEIHINASSPGSPLVSYMERNFPLESVGQKRFRVRIEIPSRSALNVSGPSVFNEFGRLPDLLNAEEAEFLLGADHEGRIISVETASRSEPTFLMRHSNKIRWAGRIAFVGGLAFSGHRIATASPDKRAEVIGEEVGGLGGGAAGTAAAVAGCVAFGIATGGLGLLVCGLVGGAAGSAIGSYIGGGIVREAKEIADAVEWAAEHSPGSFFVSPGTVTLHGQRGGFRGMLRSPLDVQREIQGRRR